MNILLISVIVCTYNRADVLAGCLESLVGQTSDKGQFEVIVVDNNSTDETEKIARTFSNNIINFRIVKEIKQGLSHARNRGWKEAIGQYVAFIDDDAIVYPDWLLEIFAFIKRHPEAGAFGGPFSAICSVALPNWLSEGYGSWNLGDIERLVTSVDELPNGTNMIFRKNLLSEIGGFDTSLGMRGGLVGYGEDTKFLMEIVKRNIPIYYAPKVKVLHRVLTNKLNIRWVLKSHFQAGKDAERVFGCSRSLFLHIICVVISVGKGMKTVFLSSGVFFKARIVKALVLFMSEVGGLHEHLLRGKRRR